MHLDADRVSEYWRRGYLHVPQLFRGQAALLEAECRRLVDEEPTVVNRIDPVAPRSSIVRALARDAVVLGALRSIFRDEDAFLLKDKLILKPPGSSGFGIHQDFAYYGWTGARPDQLIAMQIAIDDADEDNGAVCFYPEAHGAFLPATRTGGNNIDGELLARTSAVLVPTKAGDAIFFHPLTPHRSDVNRSERYRRTLYLTYSAAAAGDLYRVYYQHRGEALGVAR